MTLDLLKVGPQVAGMARYSAAAYRQHGSRLDGGPGDTPAQAPHWEELARSRLAPSAGCPGRSSRSTCAPRRRRLRRGPHRHRHGWLADRAGPPRRRSDFFLLNVGWAVVRYGAEPFAELASEPTLFFRPRTRTSPTAPPRPDPGPASERQALRAGDCPGGQRWRRPGTRCGPDLVVLADGTLALWVLEERPDDFLRQALVEPYVEQLQRIRSLDRPLASYISRPRSIEVSELLKRRCDRRAGPVSGVRVRSSRAVRLRAAAGSRAVRRGWRPASARPCSR